MCCKRLITNSLKNEGNYVHEARSALQARFAFPLLKDSDFDISYGGNQKI